MLKKNLPNILFFLFCCFAFFQIKGFYGNYTIFLISTVWVFFYSWRKKTLELLGNPMFWVFSACTWFSFLVFLNSNLSHEGWRKVETGVMLIAFPLILGTIGRIPPQRIRFILIVYALGVIGYSTYSLVYDIAKTQLDFPFGFSLTTIEKYKYVRFSDLLGLQPDTLGGNLAFASIIFLDALFAPIKKKRYILLKGLCPLFIISGYYLVILTGSRTSFIALLLSSCLLVLLFLFSSRKTMGRKNRFLFFFSLSFTFFLLIYMFFSLNTDFKKFNTTRYSTGMNEVKEFIENRNAVGSMGTRIGIWQTIYKNRDSVMFRGTDTTDITERLVGWYNEEGLSHAASQRYGSHNQYLNYFVSYGIAGVFLFVVSLLIPFVIALRQKKHLYTAFILFIGTMCIAGNYLSVMYGVFVYSFFNSLFFFHFLRTPNKGLPRKSSPSEKKKVF